MYRTGVPVTNSFVIAHPPLLYLLLLQLSNSAVVAHQIIPDTSNDGEVGSTRQSAYPAMVSTSGITKWLMFDWFAHFLSNNLYYQNCQKKRCSSPESRCWSTTQLSSSSRAGAGCSAYCVLWRSFIVFPSTHRTL